ncbi:MAG: hypothetical protein NC082_02695 [Clostridiales bacterium]|nr:hypothetical protein [Clostridiales bacterium]
MKDYTKKYILYPLAAVTTLLCSCIEDSITTSPSSQPSFSVDTLAMGTLFSGEGSPTYAFKIFNGNSKGLNLSRIALRDDSEGLFRLNVDGMAGREFSNVEVRGKDSIFVFVEATLPDLDLTAPTLYEKHLDVTTNGVTSTVVITAVGLDATRLTGVVIERDTQFDSSKPYIIYDSLVVAPGARLSLEAGTKLHFHEGAGLKVDGQLEAHGTAADNVEMTGDRWGNVVGRVDYEIMSGQWEGVYFSPESHDNRLEYTSIRNTVDGVIVDSVPYTAATPSLYMYNCQLRNSKGYTLLSSFSSVEAIGCELAEAASGVLALQGGEARLVNCTIANYYLFSVLGGAAVQFYHAFPDEEDTIDEPQLPLLKATLDNCIIYGLGKDLSHGDLTGSDITLRRCLLKSEGSDDDNFLECMWGEDPLYYTVREDYYFDYRLQPESPAIGAASINLMDPTWTETRLGDPISNNLGCY